MKLFGHCLFFLLSLSISSTTNSDHTNAEEELERKGGDGAKRSRVRRQNLNLPDALLLQEKAYALYVLWRLLNEVSNNTNAIRTSTMRPEKIESMTSEGPKNTEIVFKAKDKPSSAPTQEQSTHSTGITVTNDSTAMASFPTDPSSPYLQKTTQSGDSRLVKQSTQRLQTTIQKIPEPSQVTDQHKPDSTTFKTVEEPSDIMHEESTRSPATAMAYFPTHLPESQKTTRSGDSLLVEQSTMAKQKIIESSQFTEQHISHSKTSTIKMSTEAVKEPSSDIMHEESTRSTGTNDSTVVTSYPTELPPQESEKYTQSGAPLFTQQSTQHLQRSKQEISKPRQVTDQHNPDSTTLTKQMSSKAVAEPSSTLIHERIDNFTGITDTKNSTVMAYFPTNSPDSQKTTQSGDSLLVEQSTMAKQKIIEYSQFTEQHISHSKTSTIKMSTEAVKEPSSDIMHEESTRSKDTNDSTAVTSYPTELPPQESEKYTQSGAPLFTQQSTQHLQRSKQEISESSQVTEEHIPDSPTLTIKFSSKAVEEPSSTLIHERIDNFTAITDTKNSTVMAYFPTNPPDSQKITQSGDSLLVEQSTMAKQKIIESSQFTEEHISHSKTSTIKMSTEAVKEPSSDIMHEESTHSTSTNDSTAVTSYPTELPPQESQKYSQSGAPLFTQQSTQHLQRSKQEISKPRQVTDQHIPDSTTLTKQMSSKAVAEPSSTLIHEQIDNFTGITDTKNSTVMAYFPTNPPDSQKITQSGDSLLVEQSTMAKQKIIESSQFTEEHISHSKISTIKMSTEAVKEPSSDIMHEVSTHSTGTNDSTVVTSYPTELPPQESQKYTQSGAPLFTQQSTQHLQRSKQEISESSQVTEEHIPDSPTLTIKFSSKAVEEPSSTLIHEQIDNFTGITDTKNSTVMAYFPTIPPDSQKTTQSGDSLLVEQSTMAKQKIIESSQFTEEHISHSKTSTIKMSTEAVEEPSSNIMHEESTRSTGTNDSTAVTSYPTELPPQESQKYTQSGAPLFTQQSTQHLQHSKQEISKPRQVTVQHNPDSTTLTKQMSSKAVEEPSSTLIHERIDYFTGITDTKDYTATAYFPKNLPDSQKTTQSGDSLLVEQSTMAKQKIIESSQFTEENISHSKTSTIKMSTEAVKEPSSDIMHEESTHSTSTNDSTAVTSYPTELPPQESQKYSQSGAPLFTQQSTQHLQRSKQEISKPRQVTDQHIPDSTTLTKQMSSKAVAEPSSTLIHERIDHFTGITDTKNSTLMAYFPTNPPDSQKITQSGDSLIVEQSTMAKQKIIVSSKFTEQHISHSKTSTIKMSTEAVKEPSSDIMHEESNRSTGTNDSTAVTSYPTELPPQESEKYTQSGAPLFTQQSTQHLQRSKQEISESSQVTEEHIPDSPTLTIQFSSKAVEEPSSTLIHEQIDNFTGITDTKNSTVMAYFPTNPPDSQKITQSGDSLLVEQSTMAKQKIIESSQFTEEHISHSKTSTIKMSTEAVKEPSSDIMHEESTRSTSTNDSTAVTSYPTELPPQESQKYSQSGAPLFTQQSTQHLQHSKQEISKPRQVTVQHIPDATTLTIKISSKAAEEPSSTIIHEQIDHFTGITAMASFPTHSQKTTLSEDSQLVEQSKQKITVPSQITEQHIPNSKTFTVKIPSKAVEEHSSTTIHDQIARFTGMTGTTDSTATMSFQTDLASQESQKNTQSGAPRLLKQSTQHFQSPKSHKIPKPSQESRQSTALMSIPVIATAYRNEKETLLQTAINSHITNHGIPVSTRGNNSLLPILFLQTMKHEHPRRDITGMEKGISKPTLPARTKNPTLSSSAVKLEILETATYTHSVTLQNGKPNQFVVAPKTTPPAFTLKQQIQDSTSLLITEERPISHLNGFTSDTERHKPTPAEEPTNQHTEQNANNTEKSSRDSFMQHFMTTKTRILTYDSSVSSKTASTSPLPSLTEARLVDSKGPVDISVPASISQHVSTSSAAPCRTSQMNPKTQSQSTTNKYPIHGTIMSHTSVHLSQTIPVSTEKITVTFAPNPTPSEKDTHTTSVMRHGFLTLRTQEIPFWISTKRSKLHPIETKEPQSDLTNQEPTTYTVEKENHTNNDLLTEMDKPTQSTIGHKLSKKTRTATTKLSKTQKVSQNPNRLQKSSDTAIKDDMQTGRGIFGLLFSLGSLILLIIIFLLWVVWRSWQAWHWRNNIWVAGSPVLCGTYHSVLQSSSPHTAIEMTKGNTQKNKQENHDVDESIALKQQQKDLH